MNRRNLTLIATGTLFLSCLAFSPGPGRTVEKFYRLVEEGEVEQAMDLLSEELVGAMGATKLKAAIREQTESIKAKGGIKSIKIVDEDITGDIAQVVAEVTFGDGQTSRETGKLIKEKGKWKLALTK